MKVVIVGGVAGGASVAARARRLNEKAEIILFERGNDVSYANCGLPYYIGGVIEDEEELFLQTPESFWNRFHVKVRVQTEVVSVDKEAKKVTVRDLKSGEEYDENYDKLVLSPGGAAFVPPIPGKDLPKVYKLRSVADTFQIKALVESKEAKRAAVIGGGFIGLEIAENLCHRGLEVTIVEGVNQVFPPFDFELAGLVKAELLANGVNVVLDAPVKGIFEGETGYIVQYGDGGSLECDFVVMAIGVRPDTVLAESASLKLNARGAIVVDEYMRTSDPDIYAAGDAVQTKNLVSGQMGVLPLAGPANKQGRIIAENLFEEEKIPFKGVIGSSVAQVFNQTFACTGLNERTCKALGIQYKKIYAEPFHHAGYYPGAKQLTIKLIYAPDGKILGCQIAGEAGVEKRIDVVATAIKFGGKVSDLAELELCYAPPYSSAKDPINYAGFIAENEMSGRGQVWTWDMLAGRDKDKTVLVDLRTSEEVEAGAIPGSINIPVDELRDRLDEIPKDKELWVYCQVGLRGYIGQRILLQSGFNHVLNLSGGYRLLTVCGLLPQ